MLAIRRNSTLEPHEGPYYRLAVQIDRWVFPPAVAVAVFTTVAITPPGGPLPRGLRVEIAGNAEASRPLLIRLAIEESGTPRWFAPSTAAIRVVSSNGRTVAGRAASSPRVPYAFATLTPEGAPPYRLQIAAAGGFAAETLLPQSVDVPAQTARTIDAQHDAAGVELVVEGGVLVPEVRGTILVRVEPANTTELAVESSDGSVRLDPLRLHPDACGVAMMTATVQGLDARIALTPLTQPARVTRRRLPVAPGALTVHATPSEIEVTSPVGNQVVYVLSGDVRGPIAWFARRLDDVADANSTSRFPLALGSQWALASLSPFFDPHAGSWLIDLPNAGCSQTALGLRFSRAALELPDLPQLRLVFDGASFAGKIREARQQKVRMVAAILAAAALSMLVFLVVRAGLSTDPDTVRALAARRRIGFTIAMVATLLAIGGVLLSVFFLRF